ncbi:MAG: HNH endonuclease [Myxococcales bacterium]
MSLPDLDGEVRAAAFAFLDEQTKLQGEVLPWRVLLRGFDFRGRRVPLVSQQGIFKPALLPDMPISIRTTPPKEGKDAPYEDRFEGEDVLLYHYRTDPAHRDNAGLRRAMTRHARLIYFYGIEPGRYAACWPVFVVGDDPASSCFRIEADDRNLVLPGASEAVGPEVEGRRRYVTATVLRRLHQASFRERVLTAYRTRCAICHLRHRELLDAAHIMPDSDPRGVPSVQNGLSLCKLHHAAFDGNLIGVRPDFVVEVRREVLDEHDGPMLQHGLKEIAGTRLKLPAREILRPRADLLEERYTLFRRAG